MRRSIIAFVIAVLIAPTVTAHAQNAAKPAYVVQAEHNYRRARAGLKAAQVALARLEQEEARLGRQAMRAHGQWIEPAKLWQAKLAAQHRLAFAQQTANQSLVELNDARDAARVARAGRVPQPEPLSTPFWEF
ncbi:MAG: hypothetical protein WAK01_10895 [Methylocystis sp.]